MVPPRPQETTFGVLLAQQATWQVCITGAAILEAGAFVVVSQPKGVEWNQLGPQKKSFSREFSIFKSSFSSDKVFKKKIIINIYSIISKDS